MNDSEQRTFPPIGASTSFSKTVAESDVYLFAGITGDFAPQHVNEQYMAAHPYGRRVAHGVLILGLSSTASSLLGEKYGLVVVSYGYDRLRFVRPVFIGDTVTVNYSVHRVDVENRRSYAKIEALRTDGQVCMVAEHILYYV
jgi:3-hydroxybutyryl-CoA dehydratase